MNILSVVMLLWLVVVAIAWCIDNGTEILAERRAAKKRREAQAKEKEAVELLTVATLHHARMRSHRPGAHRLNKAS